MAVHGIFSYFFLFFPTQKVSKNTVSHKSGKSSTRPSSGPAGSWKTSRGARRLLLHCCGGAVRISGHGGHGHTLG